MSDMPTEEFRKTGHELVDWIADYLAGNRALPVLSRSHPGDLRRALPAEAPAQGESMEDILRDFERVVMPGITHWNHPRFHGYFSVSASGPGILAEMLTAALNVNGMLWKSSPAATELEQLTLGWLRQWLDLPESFFGSIFDTASTSTMHALAAAREFVDPAARLNGSTGRLTVYTSEQAHSSVEKGAIAIGFGQSNVRRITVDNQFRMIPGALAAAMEKDKIAGKVPCCVVPTAGTTSTSSIDPILEVSALATRFGAWLHVDAAYGGCAAILPEVRSLLKGIETAHSIVVNPHKWLFTPLDLSVLYTSRPDVLRRAFSLAAEYLKTEQDGQVVNYMDYGVPLGRRFRSLKLFFVMRYFGREGMQQILRNHLAWAQEFAQWIEADPRFELASPVPLGLVCFRFEGTDAANQSLLETVNAGGTAFLSHTVLHGRLVLRMSVGNIRAARHDLVETWQAIQSAVPKQGASTSG